jgi:ABC-type transport system involved in multi-copper enzyme maturation permease subunit
MFTLIKREIEDNLAFFLAAITATAILVVLLVSAVLNYDPPHNMPVYAIGFLIPVIVIVVIGIPAMGVSQMYTDRTRRVSAFLSGLPVTRSQILIARIVTGVLAILIVVVPLMITGAVLRQMLLPPIPIYPGLIADMSATAFLMAFACYCLGLLTGWTSSRITPTLSGLVPTFVLIPLIVVKGFGLHTTVILVLFIIASLVCTWQKFKSAAF